MQDHKDPLPIVRQIFSVRMSVRFRRSTSDEKCKLKRIDYDTCASSVLRDVRHTAFETRENHTCSIMGYSSYVSTAYTRDQCNAETDSVNRQYSIAEHLV